MLGAFPNVDPHAPFARLTLVLIAVAFQRTANHPDVGRVGDGDNGIFLRGIGNRLERGTIPKPIKIGDRAVAWLASEIEKWQAERVAPREGASEA